MSTRDAPGEASAGAALNSEERRAVGVLAAVFAVRMLGLFLLLPVLALYAAQLPGARPELIGLAVGAYGITQAVLQVPFGLASDRWGRKPVILAGLALFGAGSLLAATHASLAALIAGRALQGAGAISAAVTALLADHLREDRRTRAMAVLGACIGGSFVLSLILGPTLAAWIGVPGIFLLTVGMALAAMLLLAVLPEPPVALEPPALSAELRILRGPLFALDAGIFLLHFMLTATFVATPFLLEAQAGPRHGWVYLAALAGSLAGTLPLILWSERRAAAEAPTGIAIAGLLAAELLLILAAGTGLAVLWAALMVFFAAFNFLEARLPALLSRLAPRAQRGAAMGVYATAQFLGAFAGGVAGGLALAAGGERAVFALCAAASLAWLGIAWRARTAVKSPQSEG